VNLEETVDEKYQIDPDWLYLKAGEEKQKGRGDYWERVNSFYEDVKGTPLKSLSSGQLSWLDKVKADQEEEADD